MLDLNIDAVSVDSACDETDPNPKNAHTFLADDSGASSSVVNADERPSTAISVIIDEEASNSSSATHTTLKFSILNSRDNHVIQIVDNDQEEDDDHQVFVTRQLFPVPKTESFSLTTTTMTRPQQWLKLSVPEAAVEGVEIGIYNKVQQKQHVDQPQQQQQQVKKSRRGPRSRSSQYRGVTFYRRTGRWESHIWDCGKQVYLGGFDTAHAAARAYDRAAIKFRGVDADINFHISDYEDDMKLMKNLAKEEFVRILRRQSNGFSWGSSKYRGAPQHKCGRWDAPMGQFLGQKYVSSYTSNPELLLATVAARWFRKT